MGKGFAHFNQIAVGACFGNRFGLGQAPYVQAGRRLIFHHELPFGAFCQNRFKWDSVPKEKRPFGVWICHPEHLIDGLHQFFGGPIIGAQGIGFIPGIPAGFQIGMNIRSAKGINGLLGVTDHQ